MHILEKKKVRKRNSKLYPIKEGRKEIIRIQVENNKVGKNVTERFSKTHY